MATNLTPTELAVALIAGCQHHGLDWGEEAALRLLIAHRTWLRREELRAHVSTQHSSAGLIAWLDWTQVANEPDRSPASSGELALLRLACHLAGRIPEDADNRWALSELLMPLDATNALRASRAVAIAALGPDTVGPLQ
jgi:hypothetical protein